MHKLFMNYFLLQYNKYKYQLMKSCHWIMFNIMLLYIRLNLFIHIVNVVYTIVNVIIIYVI